MNDFLSLMRPVGMPNIPNPYFSFTQTGIGNIGGLMDMGWQAAAARGMLPMMVNHDRRLSGLTTGTHIQQQRAFQQLLEYQQSTERMRIAAALSNVGVPDALKSIGATGLHMAGMGNMFLQGGQMSPHAIGQLQMAAGHAGNAFFAPADQSKAMLQGFQSYFGMRHGQTFQATRAAGLSADELAGVTSFAVGRLTTQQRRSSQARVETFLGDVEGQLRNTAIQQLQQLAAKNPAINGEAIVDLMRKPGNNETTKKLILRVGQEFGLFGEGGDDSEEYKNILRAVDDKRDAISKSSGLDLNSGVDDLSASAVMVQAQVDEFAKIYALLGESAYGFTNALETAFGRESTLNVERVRGIATHLQALSQATGQTFEELANFMTTASQNAMQMGGRRLTDQEALSVVRHGAIAMMSTEGMSHTGRLQSQRAAQAAMLDQQASPFALGMGFLATGDENMQRIHDQLATDMQSSDPSVVNRARRDLEALNMGSLETADRLGLDEKNAKRMRALHEDTNEGRALRDGLAARQNIANQSGDPKALERARARLSIAENGGLAAASPEARARYSDAVNTLRGIQGIDQDKAMANILRAVITIGEVNGEISTGDMLASIRANDMVDGHQLTDSDQKALIATYEYFAAARDKQGGHEVINSSLNLLMDRESAARGPEMRVNAMRRAGASGEYSVRRIAQLLADPELGGMRELYGKDMASAIQNMASIVGIEMTTEQQALARDLLDRLSADEGAVNLVGNVANVQARMHSATEDELPALKEELSASMAALREHNPDLFGGTSAEDIASVISMMERGIDAAQRENPVTQMRGTLEISGTVGKALLEVDNKAGAVGGDQ